ncbi:MAG: hypothetical protein CMQ24_21450 [Gammaproteobacteria bacterium]|nr:hypothetical protein [Gammaproteobacteria bacterium]
MGIVVFGQSVFRIPRKAGVRSDDAIIETCIESRMLNLSVTAAARPCMRGGRIAAQVVRKMHARNA